MAQPGFSDLFGGDAMRSRLLVAICLLMLGAAPPAEFLVPDPNWVPNSGDRAEVTKDGIAACPDISMYSRYLGSLKANDSAGLKNFPKLPKGTPVLILRSFRPPKEPQSGRVFRSTEAFLDHLQTSALTPVPNYSDTPVEVRILDGEGKGKTGVIPESAIVPMILPEAGGYTRIEGPGFTDKHFYEFPPLPPGTNAGTPEVRAVNLLRVGLKAERTGDIGRAIACYHRLSRDLPNLPEAKTAVAHMDAMGVVRTREGGYVYDPAVHLRQRKVAPRSATEAKVVPSAPGRAATLLSTAKNLEKMKKAPAAIEAYRRVAKEFPGSSEAKEAEVRIKALGGK